MTPKLNMSHFRTYSSYLNCEIIAIPERYDIKPYAYGFQKNSPFLGPFNYYLKLLREKGSTKQILEKYETRGQVLYLCIIILRIICKDCSLFIRFVQITPEKLLALKAASPHSYVY